MNLRDYARVSVSKTQGSSRPKIQTFAYYGALSLSILGTLGGILGGCAKAPEVTEPANTDIDGSKDNAATVENVVDENSVDWEEQGTFDEQAYREYLTNFIKTYDKNADSLEVQDVVDFAVQLGQFTVHANADIQADDDLSIDKSLLILSNQAEDVAQKGNTNVRKTISDKHITDNLMSLSEQLKVCKVLTASPIELVEGNSVSAKVTAQPSNAELKLQYSMANSEVASVDSKGTVKALKVGVTTLTITDANTKVSTQVKITVKAKEHSQSESSKSTDNKSGTTGNNSSKNNSGSTDKSGNSSNSSKKSGGTTTTPKVIKVTDITLPVQSLTLEVGTSVDLTPTITPSNATDKRYDNRYTNGNIAYYDGKTVRAISAGTCQVGVTTLDGSNITRYITVTVIDPNANNQPSQPSQFNQSSQYSQPSQSTQNQSNQSSQSSQSSNTNNGNSGTDQSSQSSQGSSQGGNNQSSQSSQSSTPVSNWNASEHTKVYSTGGYEMYECPEIVQYINKYRRQNGLSDLQWYNLDNTKILAQAQYDSASDLEKKMWQMNGDVDSNGKVIVNASDIEDGQMIVRDSLEYCIVHNTLDHGNDYNPSNFANINALVYDYNPAQWVESIKTSAPHWRSCMYETATTVYAVYIINPSTGMVTLCVDVT